ncbi:CHAD domain-containing protein [Nitrosomonas sp.]|uniref:CHAD domain-containing protein n=1 Tax=Nitrosomonas sp. TaxID=42353 RepID=UPI0025EB0C45|nr:CHAD domain-containing protein [Nitrosomonas sp.]
MNSLPENTWELNEVARNTDILSEISSEFDIEANPGTTSNLQFYDDFDSHLWKANYLLCQVNKQQFQLIDPSGCIGEVGASSGARFWWEFSGNQVKDKLQSLVGLRAVLPIASINLLETDFSLRNDDQKIVVRGRLTQTMVGNKIGLYLTLQALRGYAKYYTRAAQLLRHFIKAEINHFGLRFLLMVQGIQALEPKQGALLSLTEDMRTEQAVRAMATAMLVQTKLYVGGVIADTDTEFLHQFRVNVRKLRSLISLLKQALPTSMLDTLKPRLSSIAGKTNKLRDLDVFILAQDSYRAMLPANFESGLNELYRLIEKQRKQEKNKVAKYLSSTEYRNDVATCAAELSQSSAFQTPMASKPVLQAVKKLLLKRYHKMLAMSAAINSQSADEKIHELRIEFKKLRYLIEFFVDLLPKKRTGKIVSEIKKIQTVLGNYNDYCIQIEFLNSYIDDTRIEMSKALSGLIAILYRKKTEERPKVEGALADFFTENMTIEFDLVFEAAETGDSE